MKKTTLITSIFCIILSSQVYLNAADYLARAVVTGVEGKATYSSPMQSGDIIKGMALPQTYSIRTGKDATVDLILTFGIAIRIYPNTKITLETLDIISKGLPSADNIDAFTKRVSIKMITGNIMVNIPESTKNIDFKVKTKFGVISADKPSVFEVTASASTAEAKAGLGEIKVTSRKKQTDLKKGESVIMTDTGSQIKPISTGNIDSFAAATTATLKKILSVANPTQTESMINAIGNEFDTPIDETPSPTPTTKPKKNEVVPPDPIKEGDPSKSEPII